MVGRLQRTLECHQLTTIGSLAAAGLGVSAVPALCARQMQQLGARCIPLREPAIERRVGIIMHPGFRIVRRGESDARRCDRRNGSAPSESIQSIMIGTER